MLDWQMDERRRRRCREKEKEERVEIKGFEGGRGGQKRKGGR